MINWSNNQNAPICRPQHISNNGESWETVSQVLQKTQHDVQLRNDILNATEGAISLNKCFCQVQSFIFAKDGAPVVAPAEKDWEISIKDATDNTIQSMPVISPYTPFRSLGTFQCHSKNQPEQFQTQLKKSKQLARELVCSGISSQCAWVHYTAIFIPSITYPFPVCHMNDTPLQNL